MTDRYYEIVFSLVFLIFWVIVPAIIGICLIVFFARLSKAHEHYKKISDDRKWNIKWKHTWSGKPYIADSGWGTKYSKKSELDYFNELNKKKGK